MKKTTQRLVPVLLACVVGACNGDGGGWPPPSQTEFGEREIVESDLYKLVGDWLYVQNPSSGLHVIDVSDPDDPVPATHIEIAGQAGELYVQEGRVIIVFEMSSSPCEVQSGIPRTGETATAEIAVVTDPLTDPGEAGRFCLPGILVASRIVGDILYAVTTERRTTVNATTWLFSIDVSDSEMLVLSDVLVTTDYTHEVHVNDEAIFLAQHAEGGSGCWEVCTNVRYIDISDPAGAMVERDDILLTGAPQGRSHMDATDDYLRIVTVMQLWWPSSSLHVIDIRDPSHLVRIGFLRNFPSGGDLHAVRFEGDKVYVVTFENRVLFQDPLWVIDLESPTSPEIIGHLEVPGWSDWIFPRGNRLVAVGRGDRGASVAVSLFDVSDLENPAELERLEFGRAEAVSEANLDFRGISIVESLGDPPLIAVPFTNNTWPADECVPEHYLQLIDLLPGDLELQGTVQLDGRIRRTVPIGDRLYSITDEKVVSLDVSDRTSPSPGAVLDLAAPGAPDPCLFNDFDIPPPDVETFSYFSFGCSQVGPGSASTGCLVVIILSLLVLGLGRCRKR